MKVNNLFEQTKSFKICFAGATTLYFYKQHKMYWEIIREQARISVVNKTIWESMVEKRKYQIISVTHNKIVIKRISGGKDIALTQKKVEAVIPNLVNKGRLPKTGLANTVALESMMIHLHPFIFWNEQTKEIFWKEGNIPTASEVEDYINSADNDTLKKIQTWITKRQNQGKFKENILKLYNNTCAITGCKVAATLDAAHIEPHSENGNNQNENGILLRADIHKLFDRGLLRIDPKTFKVQIDTKIKDKEYQQLNGKIISKTKDETYPSKSFLRKRWNAK